MGRRIAVVIDGKRQILTGEPNDEEGGTSADHDRAAHDHDHTQTIANAIVSLTNEYRTRGKQSQREQKKNNRWVKAGTIFVAFYTAIIFFQSCVTWKVFTHTVDAAHLDQRASACVGRSS